MSRRSPAATAVAAHGLATRWTLPDRPLPMAAWRDLAADVDRSRLIGLLGAAVQSGALPVTEEQRASLQLRVSRWMVASLALERLALRTTTALDDAGIPHRVLKGVALAHTLYGRPDLRTFGDVDLAVPSSDIVSAIDVLTDRLGPRVEPELRPGFDRDFGKGATFRTPKGEEVDVHRNLVWGAMGFTVVNDDLFAAATPFDLGGRTLCGLGREAMFLHACYTSVVGDVPPRLVALRDVAECLRHDQLDIERVLVLAERWRARLVMARALAGARDELALTDDHPLLRWSDEYRAPRPERLLLRSHLMPGGTYARRVAAVAVIPGVRQRVRYLWMTAVPSREYLRSRDFTWGTHVRRSIRFVQPPSKAAGE